MKNKWKNSEAKRYILEYKKKGIDKIIKLIS